jgi:serine/threonine-protein kinase
MGEVFRATDTKLGREVALKVLPFGLTADPDRLTRFRNEARALASLQHPNVASIYGLEEVDNNLFLVMELAEGEDLSDRIKRGPLPLDQVLEIAAQIASGLEEAHEKGIVHRDLKPANIKLSEDGKVKILDFGLARAYEGETMEGDPTASPTMTAAMTQAGVILGTAAYMSPEQARGHKVDQKADLWALGVVIFEMLTGRQLFAGDTVSDTLAAVLRKEIPWDDLPTELPPALRRVLTRCLERDPRQRLQSAGDTRIELTSATGETPVPANTEMLRPARGIPRRVVFPVMMAVVILAALTGRFSAPSNTGHTATESTRLDISLVTEGRIYDDLGPGAILTPDGRTIVYLQDVDTVRRLMVRHLDEEKATVVPGTEGAVMPFMSPDGKWIGFFAANRIKKVWIGGGMPLDICTADGARCRGAAWGVDDKIVFTPSTSSALYLVDAAGGEPVQLTTLDKDAAERSHRWPEFLPDGKHVVFNIQYHGQDYHDGNIEVVEVATGNQKVVHRGGAFPRPADANHLTFIRENTVFLVEVDQDGTPRSEPRPVLSDVSASTGDETAGDGSAVFNISPAGDVLFRRGKDLTQQGYLAVVDMTGNVTRMEAPVGTYYYPRVSPNGRTVAISTARSGRNELWLFDLVDGSSARLVSTDGVTTLGFWSPDSEFLYFAQGGWSARGLDRIFVAGGGVPEEVLRDGSDLYPHDFSRDGRYMFINRHSEQTSWDIMVYDLETHPEIPLDPANLKPFVASPAQDGSPRVSPDGLWVAYEALETGNREVYLADFNNPSRRWMVSNGGGADATWDDDGQRIFFLNGGRMMAVDLNPGQGGLRPSNPYELFEVDISQRTDIWNYDKIPGKDQFVMIMNSEETREPWPGDLVYIRNWRAGWEEK